MKHDLMKDIVAKLNKATKAYDRGEPYMTDKEWDRLYYKLEELEKELGYTLPDSPTNNIIYEVEVAELNKVNHNHRMLSLAKTKNLLEAKTAMQGKEYLMMLKIITQIVTTYLFQLMN